MRGSTVLAVLTLQSNKNRIRLYIAINYVILLDYCACACMALSYLEVP